MRILLTSGFLLLLSTLLWAQDNPHRHIVNSASNHLEGENGATTFILGQTVVGTLSNDNITIEQGLSGGELIATPIENINTSLEMEVFPNPSSQMINIQGKDMQGMIAHIYDVKGQLWYRQNITSDQESIDVVEWPTGIYLLKISDSSNKEQAIFKIEKN